MVKRKNKSNLVAIKYLLVLSIALSACGSNSSSNATIIEPETPQVPESQPSPTTNPTPTTEPPSIVFISDETSSDPEISTQSHPIVVQFALDQQINFVELGGLNSAEFPGNPVLVVVVMPVLGLAEFAISHPNTQFIAVGDGIEPGINLTVVSAISNQSAAQGFVAGYLAAIQTEDWRVGMLATSDIEGQLQREGFVNGVQYFCGLCLPVYPPYGYPLYGEQPKGSDTITWKISADQLIAQGVRTVYLSPNTQSAELLNYFANANVKIIGSSVPQIELTSNWMTSVEINDQQILFELMTLVLENGAQGIVSSSVQFNNENFDLVSLARFIHIQEIIEQIQTGYVDPLGD